MFEIISLQHTQRTICICSIVIIAHRKCVATLSYECFNISIQKLTPQCRLYV